MLIVFHRPESRRFFRPKSLEAKENAEKRENAVSVPVPDMKEAERSSSVAKSGMPVASLGIGESEFAVKASGSDFTVKFSTTRNGTLYKGEFSAKHQPGRRIFFYYNNALGAVVQEELGGGLMPTRRLPNGEGYFYIGQVLMTDSDSLLWLRGRFADIPGVKNFHALERENSIDVFCRYSRAAARIIKAENELADKLSGIDVTSVVDRLQTQVNLLARLVLNPEQAEKDGLKAVLAASITKEQSATDAKKRLARNARDAAQLERAYR